MIAVVNDLKRNIEEIVKGFRIILPKQVENIKFSLEEKSD